MSQRLPRITARELIRALRRDGWELLRQSSSHAHFGHGTKRGRVTVPVHAGVTLKPKTLESALEQAGLTVAELRELLR